MGEQALVQLADELGDAVPPGVVAKPVAGRTDLAAAGPEQHAAVEIWPALDWAFKLHRQGCRPGKGDTYEPLQIRTSVLARV
jgi:hypothetical protein